MTDDQYFAFSRLFDAARTARISDDCRVSVVLFGDVAGAALRRWATQRQVILSTDTYSTPALGEWHLLQATDDGDIAPLITIHLDLDLVEFARRSELEE